MISQDRQRLFEELILPHLHAAYNLARWLTRNAHDAEDAVQEAYLRAFRSFDTFRGGDGKGWVLTIVRNTCYSWLERNRQHEPKIEFDEMVHCGNDSQDPEAILFASVSAQQLRDALADLPFEFREAIVLRELDGLSYKDIAQVANVPIGTVMSRLARGRKRLLELLTNAGTKETLDAV